MLSMLLCLKKAISSLAVGRELPTQAIFSRTEIYHLPGHGQEIAEEETSFQVTQINIKKRSTNIFHIIDLLVPSLAAL